MASAPQSARRLPSLDGLRAIAIALVCLGHLTILLRGNHPAWYTSYLNLGELGVTIFFVLSGFLITSLLLREMQSTGSISLGRFYFRRALRIFPAFYAFLFFVIIVNALGWIDFHYGNGLTSALYIANYFPPRGATFAHFWSLAVEEQFYFLWPAILLLLGVRRGLRAAAATVLLCSLLRVVVLVLSSHHLVHAHLLSLLPLDRIDSRFGAIAMGCLLAGTRDWLSRHGSYQRFMASRTFIAVPLTLLLLVEVVSHGTRAVTLLYTFAGVPALYLCIALCLDWSLRSPAGRIGRILNSRLFVTVGVLSYSIYIWQEIFLLPGSRLASVPLVLNLALLAVAASVSYFAVERPFLRLRQRLEPVVFAPRPRSPEAPGLSPSLRDSRRLAEATD